MKDHRPTMGTAADEGEDEVRRLLAEAGPRPEVPAADLAHVKAAFRAAWQVEVQRRQAARFTRQRWVALAAAASLVVAAGLATWWRSFGPGAASGAVARVEALAGEVRVGEADGTSWPLQPGAEVAAGSLLETAGPGEGDAGRTALRLAHGASLRLDAGTRLRLVSATLVALERGAVYVDSGLAADPSAAVAVATPLGVAREIGTQFEVRLLEAGGPALRVRVRQGEVRLAREGASWEALAGVELTLAADGTLTRGVLETHGEAWRWAVVAAPPFALEGRTLGELLDWVGRETGWRIELAAPERAGAWRAIELHGEASHLAPLEILDVVLPGAGLAAELDGGVLRILPQSSQRMPTEGKTPGQDSGSRSSSPVSSSMPRS